MVNINNDTITTYAKLIHDNPRTINRLIKENGLPIANLELNLSTLSKDDYSKLIDWSGEENTMYLVECINNYNRNWIIFEKNIQSPASFTKGDRTHKLILDMVPCLQNTRLEIKTMRFFETLAQKSCYTDLFLDINLKKYGSQTVKHNLIVENSLKMLELNVLGNWAALRTGYVD